MPDAYGLLFALALSGFHIGITLLALVRARRAVQLAGVEGRADRRTLWRLATLRFVAAVVILSGGLLALCPPLAFVSAMFPWVLPTTAAGIGIILAGTWLVWIPSTVALDNLALRWLRTESSREARGDGSVAGGGDRESSGADAPRSP